MERITPEEGSELVSGAEAVEVNLLTAPHCRTSLLQAAPGCAFLFFVAQPPGAPELRC